MNDKPKLGELKDENLTWCFRRMARFRKKIFIRTKISMPVTQAVKVVLYNVKSQLGVLNIKEFLTGISYRKPLQKSLLYVNRKVTSYNIFRSIYSGQSFPHSCSSWSFVGMAGGQVTQNDCCLLQCDWREARR